MKITSIAIAILICTLTLLTGCGNTSIETETTTKTTTIAETTTEAIIFEPAYEEKTTSSPTEGFEYLHDYGQDIEFNEEQWMISNDIYYINGKFYSNNEIIFELNTIPDMDLNSVRLLGSSCGSEDFKSGPYYIAVKSFENIWMLTIDNQQFKYELIADDAVWESEMLKFSRTDRFGIFYNNDAVQWARTVVYRSKHGGLVQINFCNSGFAKIKIESENPVLISDYSGIYWLQLGDFREYDLIDLLHMANSPENHPANYANRLGELETFTLYQ